MQSEQMPEEERFLGHTPAYAQREDGTLEITRDCYECCELCPRRCHAKRLSGARGLCGATAQLKVARSALHFWEEPPISGDRGSGAIFFSSCPLGCVFCQNQEISHGGFGLPVSVARLAEMMLELEAQGAHNINLVTPLHFSPDVIEAIKAARAAGLSVPMVCNTSGYELVEVVDALAPYIDVWLTDFKYTSADLAQKLSGAKDYPAQAQAALAHMHEAVESAGGRELDESGLMKRGIIVRHLVLPDHADDSCAVLDKVWELCGNSVDISVMNQYTPNEYCKKHGGALARALTQEEYEYVLDHADDCGFERMWWQQGGTVSESFVPAFDATGVQGPELDLSHVSTSVGEKPMRSKRMH